MTLENSASAFNKKIAILGAGESGAGAAVLAQKLGFSVWVSDKGKVADKYKQELDLHAVEWEEGTHTEEMILDADEVIKSPGIPDTAPLIMRLKDQGIPVISELEFAARYTQARMIAITGTNGKTTTTSLTYHILKKAGLNVGLAGNIGSSLARQVALENHDLYVLEVSSFQLDGMFSFHPHMGVITNITPDHLDRYNYDLNLYIQSKFRVNRNQTPGDYFIYCADDELTVQNLELATAPARRVPFSIKKELEYGAFVRDNQIIINLEQTTFTMPIPELALVGKHNTYNSMAAAIIANALEIRKESIRESLSDFQNVEHRLENAGTVGGVEFINDSKATNVNSAWYALESMDKPVIWIAGGVDKGNDYSILQPLVKEKVKYIIALGKDNRKIHEAFSKDVEMIVNTTSMQEAVHVAHKLAERGDVILLSPACASFDLFENYEDRGRQFKKAVKNL